MTPFTFPNLPTDNLYKFYALSGIVLSIFSLTLVIISTFNLEKEIQHLELSDKKLQIETLYFNSQIDELHHQQKLLSKTLESYNPKENTDKDWHQEYIQRLNDIRTDPEWRTYLEFIYKYEDQVFPERAVFKKIDSLTNQIGKSSKTLELKNAELKIVQSNLNYELIKLRFIYIFGILLFFFGAWLAYIGFKLWKTRVQDLMDKKYKLELKILKKELNRSKEQ